MAQWVEFIGNHLILVSIWLALLVFVLLLTFQGRLSGILALSPQQLVLRMNRDQAQVVDIRPAGEYRKGHILGALNLPLAEFEAQMGKLDKFKDKPLAVVCVAGLQSGAICSRLRKAGFADIGKLQGGMNAWSGAGLPVEKG